MLCKYNIYCFLTVCFVHNIKVESNFRAGIFAQLHVPEQIKEARFKTNSGSVKVQYEASTQSRTVTDSPVIVSSRRHRFLCSNRVVELRPGGVQEIPAALTAPFMTPETRRPLGLLYLSGCRAAELWSTRGRWRCINRPVCRWTARGRAGLPRELMSNESDCRGQAGAWNMYRDVFQLQSNCLWNPFLQWLMDWFRPSGKESAPTGCATSHESNQSDNNQAFQFAVSSGQATLVLFAAFSAPQLQLDFNRPRSPGDANKEMEST